MSPNQIQFPRSRTMSAQPKPEAQTVTLKEQDAAPVSAGPSQEKIIAEAVAAAMAAKTTGVGNLSGKQWTALATGVTVILGVVGSGGYAGVSAGVSTLTATEIAAQDEAHRKVVREELRAVMTDVDARVDRDRRGFEKQLSGINVKVHDIDKTLQVMAIDIAVIKAKGK